MCSMCSTIEAGCYPYRCQRCGRCFICSHRRLSYRWWISLWPWCLVRTTFSSGVPVVADIPNLADLTRRMLAK